MSSNGTEASENVNQFPIRQKDRTHLHPNLAADKPDDNKNVSIQADETSSFTFVITADTQFGMIDQNEKWDQEIEYSKRAVEAINEMNPRPLFCCVCGDLVDMTSSIFVGRPKPAWAAQPTKNDGDKEEEEAAPAAVWNESECDDIQKRQYKDFKSIWSKIHPDIALVCLCGNHDVGNRPTPSSIQQFTSQIGDDYLAFWAKQDTYNIVVNSSLFNDYSGAEKEYNQQLQWLEDRLKYANEHKAKNIFVFSHHPWFIYKEDEEYDELTGGNPYFGRMIPDGYFHIPKKHRMPILELFKKYKVDACFAGHFHQNMASETSFGMKMIITGGLSMVFESTGDAKNHNEPKTHGLRMVQIDADGFYHRFIPLPTSK